MLLTECWTSARHCVESIGWRAPVANKVPKLMKIECSLFESIGWCAPVANKVPKLMKIECSLFESMGWCAPVASRVPKLMCIDMLVTLGRVGRSEGVGVVERYAG